MRGHPSTVTDPEMIVLLEAGSFGKRKPKAAYRISAFSAIVRSVMRPSLVSITGFMDTLASSSGTMIVECSVGEIRSAGADKAGAQDMACR